MPQLCAPIVHDIQLGILLQANMEESGDLRGAFRLPPELSLFTAHNYNYETLLETNLRYLGIEGHHVLRKDVPVWSNSRRVLWFLEYLQSDECRTDLILYCDADDVILKDDPRRVIDIFEAAECDALYCSTRWPHGYQCMPEIRKWADELHPGRYLNGGVFIGRKNFLIEVYSRVAEYVTNADTEDNPDSHRFYRDEPSFGHHFPYGIGCDQAILRYLERNFYPRLKIDANNDLAWRNNDRSLAEKLIRRAKRVTPAPLKTAIKRILGRTETGDEAPKLN